MLTLQQRPIRPASFDSRPRAVVIGSGFGGLAAAVRLGARGYRVTVLEKLDAPGGRAYVYRQDGFTFDAGPTIVTAPFLFEELWALCGRRHGRRRRAAAGRPLLPHPLRRRRRLRYTGDAAAMRAEVARFAPGDVAGYERFMQRERGHLPRRLRAARPRAVRLAGPTWRGSPPDLVRLGGLPQRLRPGVEVRQGRAAADRASASIRCWSAATRSPPRDLQPDRVPRAALGRAFRDGRHRPAGRGPGRPDRGAGRHCAAARRCARSLVDGRRGDRRALASGETHSRPTSSSRTPTPPGPTGTCCRPRAPRRWTDRRIDRARYSMGLFVWYFGTDRRYDDVAHHTILLGPALPRAARDIFERKVLRRRLQPLPAPPDRDRPVARAAGLRRVLRALAGAAPAGRTRTGGRRPSPIAGDRAVRSRRPCCRGWNGAIVTSRMLDAAGLPGPAAVVRGAAFGLEPVLTQSAWFRPHNRSEEVRHLYLVGAGTHPGAGLPGVLSSARVLDKVVPHASVFV